MRDPRLEQVVNDMNAEFQKVWNRLEKLEAAQQENSNAKRGTRKTADTDDAK